MIPKCTRALRLIPTAPHVRTNAPPDHAAKLHELPDEHLAELLPIVKRIAVAVGAENYNVLQVRLAPLRAPVTADTHRTTAGSRTSRSTMSISTVSLLPKSHFPRSPRQRSLLLYATTTINDTFRTLLTTVQ